MTMRGLSNYQLRTGTVCAFILGYWKYKHKQPQIKDFFKKFDNIYMYINE